MTFFEVTETLTLNQVARCETGTQHQSLQLLPKRFCDVKSVEVLVGYRLLSSGIERMVFTVPRLHKDYFQDDIFIPTADVEVPVLTAEEWVNGESKETLKINLCPNGMPLRMSFVYLVFKSIKAYDLS